jgi:hypothetical protein
MNLVKQLSDIKFPIYSLPLLYRRIFREFNVLYIETDSGNVYVLDNKNIDGDSLSKRRLKIKYSLKYNNHTIVYNISQLIRSNYKTYIDSDGNIFHYKKTKMVDLKYHKVKYITHRDSYSVLYLADILTPIKVHKKMSFDINYVGMLHTDKGHILYEYCSEKKPNTKRKI